jgi:hypothetical protein
MSLQLLNHQQNYSVDIFQWVGNELLQISLQMLHHQWNYFVNIFERVGKELLPMPLQITDEIIPVGNFFLACIVRLCKTSSEKL